MPLLIATEGLLNPDPIEAVELFVASIKSQLRNFKPTGRRTRREYLARTADSRNGP
jgi:hypothetical protein